MTVADLVDDLNMIGDLAVVEIRKSGSGGCVPYIMVLRHQDERVFQPLIYTEDESVESTTLTINQSPRLNPNFRDYEIELIDESQYRGWKYHYFGKTKSVR